MKAEIRLSSPIVHTPRVLQCSGMFDLPAAERSEVVLEVDMPIEEKPWAIGLIVGPSGCGKASAAALTPEQRRERARAAVSARWKRKKTIPNDQAAVLARLKDGQPVALRIAPGAGGKRRRAAIEALAGKGLIKIVADGPAAVSVARPVVDNNNQQR